jgi:hypothetical protein
MGTLSTKAVAAALVAGASPALRPLFLPMIRQLGGVGWLLLGGGLVVVATSRAETDWLCELPALQWRLTDGGREGDGVCRIL